MLMSRSIRCLVIVTTFLILFVVAPQARAGVVTMAPTPNLNTVNFTMTDSISNVTVILQGGPILSDQTWALPNVVTMDGFWRFTFTLTLDSTVDDELRLVRTLQHISQPHPAVDGGLGGLFGPPTLEILAENFAPGAHLITFNRVFTVHGAHFDVFNERFTFAVESVGLDFDNIITWQYTLEGTHVPEPATLFLLGTGLAGIATAVRKRCKGHNKET